jgi:excinuclease ABC subunit C
MKQFGSLKRLRAATVEELMVVPGIGRRTAEAVLAAVAQPEAGEAQPEAGEAQPEAGAPEASGPADDAAPAGETVVTTTAPAGPAERGTPRSGSGATAEVGLVAS